MYNRVDITPEATALIKELQERYSELMFHQSGGCCDGSQPMCFQKGDFRLGYSDVCLGVVQGCEFWMGRDQFEYWQHTHLTLNAIEGRGASFSLEIPLGKRFITESRLFTEKERADLEQLRYLED